MRVASTRTGQPGEQAWCSVSVEDGGLQHLGAAWLPRVETGQDESDVGLAPSRDESARVVRRVDPNFRTTWALALMVPLFWIVARFIPVLTPVLLFAPLNVILARSDADRCMRLLGDRPVKALLAAPSPVVYLFIRYARDWDLRSGRPLWISIGVLPLVFFFEVMANIGAYAMWVPRLVTRPRELTIATLILKAGM